MHFPDWSSTLTLLSAFTVVKTPYSALATLESPTTRTLLRSNRSLPACDCFAPVRARCAPPTHGPEPAAGAPCPAPPGDCRATSL
ncbi:hypothetical protein HPB52_022440 [Rhipicephalus sanguineus]|uniref:Uncharacterized protein n=1 Tax=Rhipicephalus sanguineus TaxID=34632 RepID=A0A9D4T873_RHISA|nr:hypothetical protein HPB52_022440 [Rhipicephalus sanguineus]